jgi:hypothetical protein
MCKDQSVFQLMYRQICLRLVFFRDEILSRYYTRLCQEPSINCTFFLMIIIIKDYFS